MLHAYGYGRPAAKKAKKAVHSRGSSCSGTIDHARADTRYDSHGSMPSNHESDGEEQKTLRINDATALQSRMPRQRPSAITRPDYGRRFAGFMGLVETAR